jgi:hypothetical protein
MIAEYQFLTKIRRAIDRNPKLLSRLAIRTEEVLVRDAMSGEQFKTLAIKPEENRLVNIFTFIAKGLFFHEKGRFWPGQVSVVIEFLLSIDDQTRNKRQCLFTKQLDADLRAVPFKGDNPDVFSYQFKEVDGKTFVRMHFYRDTKVSAAYAI